MGLTLELPFSMKVYLLTVKGVQMARQYSRASSAKVAKVMHERKAGTLKSGTGKKVTSKKQAIAIGLSEARREGKKVPTNEPSKSNHERSRCG